MANLNPTAWVNTKCCIVTFLHFIPVLYTTEGILLISYSTQVKIFGLKTDILFPYVPIVSKCPFSQMKAI